MRITNSMLIRKYNRNLTASMTGYSNASEKAYTGRQFQKVSEDTSKAVVAMQTRRQLTRIEGHQSNILAAKSHLQVAEDLMMDFHDLYKEAYTNTLQGKNGTYDESQHKIIANNLAGIQDSMMKVLNSKSDEKHVFAGAASQTKPFDVDADGYLVYNGSDPEDKLYLDIGLGVKIDPDTGKPDPSSVLEYSVNGEDFLGPARNEDGTPNKDNIFNILTDLINEFEKPEGEYSSAKIDELFAKLENSDGSILASITNLGSRTAYIDFNDERLESSELSLKEKQNNVEYVDLAAALIDVMSFEQAYLATLQLGNKLIEPSFMDYMR